MASIGEIEGLPNNRLQEGIWTFDEDDWLLLAMLQDPVYAAELCWDDPANKDFGGCYRVRDYQYPLFRTFDNYAGFACARSVGKTESIKAKSFTHAFRRQRQNLLVTAPELIHLLPLTDAIEERIRDNRITREFLDTRAGKTGFTHRPFGVEFLDGTKIVGRIPRLTGTGVKGQHQPDLLIDEAQDYPERGWTEVHEAQPLDAPVLTPDGFRVMGDLSIGDHVVGVDGNPTEVLDVLDHGERPIYRVEFSDGTNVECDADHWWTVERRTGRWATRRASELRFGDAVPRNGIVSFRAGKSLGCDPYLLGVMLGDGSMTRGAGYFSTADEELLDLVQERLSDDEEFVPAGGYDYRLRKRGPRSRHGRPPLVDQLRDVGVWGRLAHQKHIPGSFLTASAADRLALLQGLIDTDGNVDRRGAIRFGSTSETLCRGVEALVRSLGGVGALSPRHDKRGYRTMYTMRFRLPAGMAPCRLSRKLKRVRDVASESYKRRVIRVVPAGIKPVRCIEVAARDGLYLAANFIPTHNTVMKDDPSFTYHFYGVHSGARDSGFYKRINQGGFVVIQVTAMQRPGWCKAEKDAAKAAYGGTQSPDYRRNIHGEAGAAASAFFVTARLVACLDQERESDYNQFGYVKQELRAEEVDEMKLPLAEILDMPANYGGMYLGGDIGLTNSPTVISLFSHEKNVSVYKGDAKRERLRLVRLYKLHRFRTRQIREAMYALGWHLADKLIAGGIDATGLGFPIFQEMEDDETAPSHLLDVVRGYFFNSKVPVGVRPEYVTKDSQGNLRDQYGSAVKEETDEWGVKRLVTYMPMIEASTRYLRDFVDTNFLLLPFDTEITTDMQGETQQRVLRVGQMSGLRKPNAFHILDSFRGAAMGYKADDIEEALEVKRPTPVMDSATI